MSIMRNMTIKRKLILIIMLTCTIALLLAGTLNLFHQYIKIRKELILSISCYAQIIGENCRAALSFEDAKDASEMLKSLEAKPSIVFACVYTKEGKVLARYRRPDITEDIPAPPCAKESYRFDKHYFKLFKEIKRGDEVVGTIYIQLDMSEMKALLQMEVGIKILFVLVCSIVACLVSLRLQRIISGPIVDLAEVAKVISEKKDYSTRAVKQSNDEVGSFIDAFNAMLEQIQQSDSGLREARDKLDERVRKRTTELTHTNEQLAKEITERKKAEDTIKKTASLLENIINSSADLIFVKDRELRTLLCNEAFARAVGKQPSEIYGKTDIDNGWLPELVKGDSSRGIKGFENDDRDALSGQVVHNTNDRANFGAETRIFDTIKFPLRNPDGNIIGVVGISRDITESKKAETALKESEGKLRSIVENSSDQIFMLDQDCKFLSINKTAADLSRKSPQEMIGKSILEMFPENIAAQFSKNIKNVFDTGKNMSIEEKMVVQGREFYNSTSLNPVNDNRGGVIAVTGIVRDITKFKQAEEAIRTNEAQLSNAMKIAHLGYWEYDVADDQFTFNDHFYDIFHTTAKKVGGYTMKSARYAELFVHPDDRQVVAIETKKALETKDPKYNRQLEHRIVYATGETGYISVRFFVVKDKQGRTIKTVGANQDITERKNIEMALRKGEERFRQVVENAGDWIWEVDIEGLYTYASPIVERVLGYKPEEVVGKKHFYDFFAPDVKEELKKAAFETFAKKESIKGFVNPNIHKNGSTVIIETSGTPIIDEKGNLCGYRGADKDITGRRQKEKELQKIHKELVSASHRAGMAEVAADVLHNVGNVLNSINVSATLITEKVTNSEVANLEKVARIINEHIDEIGTFLTEHSRGKHIPVYLTEVSKCLQAEQTDIISKLQILTDNIQHIKDIISMQQAYAKVSGVSVEVSLSQLVEDAIQINSAGLQRHGTRVVREFQELPNIEIDRQRLLQIMVNLVSNAKYALSDSDKEDKLLTLRIYRRDKDHFRIEVADNGAGILKENLTKIFSHGFTTKQNGHGFGLHSSALSTNELGGSLTVHSDGLGKGARFTLELPFKPVRVTQ